MHNLNVKNEMQPGRWSAIRSIDSVLLISLTLNLILNQTLTKLNLNSNPNIWMFNNLDWQYQQKVLLRPTCSLQNIFQKYSIYNYV